MKKLASLLTINGLAPTYGKTAEISEKTFFFFGEHLISDEKTVEVSEKTFFLIFFFGGGDHIIFRTKQQHFFRQFWTLQNHNSVIFELSPGPRSAFGAPG